MLYERARRKAGSFVSRAASELLITQNEINASISASILALPVLASLVSSPPKIFHLWSGQRKLFESLKVLDSQKLFVYCIQCFVLGIYAQIRFYPCLP
jgi:hypothetical protein